jgi:serine/threonine-protein kinase
MASSSPAARPGKTTTEVTPEPQAPRRSIWNAAPVLAFLGLLLAFYQWTSLAQAEAGGKLACSINASIDCAPVWTSGFAKQVRTFTGLPVAALGVAWSFVALVLGGWAAVQARQGGPSPTLNGALRVLSWAGLASILTFAGVSAQLGILCPTCVGTYVITFAFAVVVLRTHNVPLEAYVKGGAMTGAVTLVTVLALRATPMAKPVEDVGALPPTPTAAPSNTPGPSGSGAPVASPAAIVPDSVEGFVASLSPMQQQALADTLEMYRTAKPIDRSAAPERARIGDKFAPVVLTEWTDVMCGHCAAFVLGLKLASTTRFPKERVAIEPKHFPLDKECNTHVQHSEGNGTRCAAARALVCAEQGGGLEALQQKLFESQPTLTKERVKELAAPIVGPGLDTCMASPDTAAAIRADADMGVAAGLEGTPHLLVNGRPAPPFLPLIVALALANGDANHAAFKSLPAPKPPEPHDHPH